MQGQSGCCFSFLNKTSRVELIESCCAALCCFSWQKDGCSPEHSRVRSCHTSYLPQVLSLVVASLIPCQQGFSWCTLARYSPWFSWCELLCAPISLQQILCHQCAGAIKVLVLGCLGNLVRSSICCFKKVYWNEVRQLNMPFKLGMVCNSWASSKEQKFQQNKCQGCSAFSMNNPGCTWNTPIIMNINGKIRDEMKPKRKFYEKSSLATASSFIFLFIQTVLQNNNNLTCLCSSSVVVCIRASAVCSPQLRNATCNRRSLICSPKEQMIHFKPQTTENFCTENNLMGDKWWNVVGAWRSFHLPAEARLALSAGHSPRRPSEIFTKVQCGEDKSKYICPHQNDDYFRSYLWVRAWPRDHAHSLARSFQQ